MKGRLYLVPVPIGSGLPDVELSAGVLAVIRSVRDFVVENERTARRLLSRTLDAEAMAAVSLAELNEHTPPEDLEPLLEPLLAGRDCAILSEAGSPCIADPGAGLVQLAHRADITVCPLPGPVSLMLALMASGLGGQHFSFAGYLPVEESARRQALQDMEKHSAQTGCTWLFIETPYRNDAMIRTALASLRNGTQFCVAAGLQSAEQRIVSQSIARWQRQPYLPGKVPAVFVLSAGDGSTAGPDKAAGGGSFRPTDRPSSAPGSQRPSRPVRPDSQAKRPAPRGQHPPKRPAKPKKRGS
ncbi:MAG: hypothetical protein A2087_14745 [Spirochaetes bacterium GWD1_61_31]|nr:MAG: hypothetical protein A2Y37_12910 [Spirochaetes bacterium GWB1_60_80]OHD28683.1 MAG: hypothetical protein A2004_05860 [Spirochaetes bacterium GWC1_61_12]OHD38895.1 MAG: hypothetical protein A2087_14745 [Spirochaetes bacterium GWD1_61_31]OHD43326.1 MAG: hypothetical protein A2Y35_08605 [Spirochaetes bacterium GWE1_60_18]OHD58864.1 MAG: hypothetical protein A2Y32_08975 [Spirochaetes bacterium GWF1_60_12]